MDDRGFVPMQAVLLGVFATGATLVCGEACAKAVFWTAATGMAAWLILAGQCAVRSRGRRKSEWHQSDRKVLFLSLSAFGFPALASLSTMAFGTTPLAVLTNGTASFTAALIVIALATVYLSSLVDWYVINPFVFGSFGPALWVRDESGKSTSSRRRYAIIWVAHRGFCELVVFSSIALILAIGLVSLGNSLASNGTLPQAIESLGGAGIAFAVLGFRGPQMRAALEFALSGPVALGTWVTRSGGFANPVNGYVVDVSVSPGIKIAELDGERLFIPLAEAETLSEPSHERPTEVDDAMCEQMIRRHFRRDPQDPE